MSNLIASFAFVGRLYAIKRALDYDLRSPMEYGPPKNANMQAWKLTQWL